MANRAVSVKLLLNASDYIGNAKKAAAATATIGAGAKGVRENSAAWEQVGRTTTIAGLAIAAGIGLAVKSAADFDKQMSVVEAVSGATASEMGNLRQAALDAGAATKFSASEAAQATGELAKVGITTSDILGGGLAGALDLAAAGSLDLANAAEIAGQTMKTFKLEGKDIPRIADALAAGANKSAADVTDLSQALAQGGQVAAQTGLDLEDTVGVLSLFADNALQGSDAGTSLKTMLQRLNPQTKAAANEMKRLGLDFFDANGEFVGIEAAAGQLQTRLSGLSDQQRLAALNTIFGADAIRGALVLYDQGAEGVRTYTDAVTDQGAAARQSAVMMNNLSGDVETLQGSLETALIKGGSQATGILRELTQAATGAVDGFADLPEPVQATVLGLAALSSAGLLGVGAFTSIVPRIVETRDALETLRKTTALGRVSLGSIGTFLSGPWGLALGAGAIALGALTKSAYDSKHQFDDLLDTLDQTTGAITEKTRLDTAQILITKGAYAAADRLGLSQRLVTEAALGNVDALSQLRAAQSSANVEITKTATFALPGQIAAFGSSADAQQRAADAASRQQGELSLLLGVVTPLSEALGAQSGQIADVADKAGIATGATQGLSMAQYDAAAAAEDMADAQKDLVQSVRAGNVAFLTQQDSIRGYEAAVDAAAEAVKENGKTLDVHTAKGRANEEALYAVGTSALAAATDIYANTGSMKAALAQADSGRAAFVKYAGQMGLNAQKANALADEIGLTRAKVQQLGEAANSLPSSKTIAVKVTGITEAVNGIGYIKQTLTDLNGKTITVRTRYVEEGRRPNGGVNTAGGITKASGGYISGPGTSTSDSIPAWLSTGEYVIRAAAVKSYGTAFFDQLNTMRFASGGVVPRASTSTAPAVSSPAPSYVVNAYGPSAADVAREFRAQQRRDAALSPSWGG